MCPEILGSLRRTMAAATKEELAPSATAASPATTATSSPLELLYRHHHHRSQKAHHQRSFDLAAAAAELYAVACTAAAAVTAGKQQLTTNGIERINQTKAPHHLSFEEDVDDGMVEESSEEEEIVMEYRLVEEVEDDRTDTSNSDQDTPTDEDEAVEVDYLSAGCSSKCAESAISNGYSTESIPSSASSCSSQEDSKSTRCTANALKASPWRKVRSLVTSPFIQTYKRQKYPWIQLAGHQGNFLAGQMQGTILKKKSGNEEKCFKAIMDDDLKDFVPQYKSVVHLNGESYIELEDLLANFTNPSIMDIKMGVRTYLEEELIKAGEKPKLRKDMYEKMVAIDPHEPTAEEHALRAVTKPRYMVWRESISSTSTLGFRIDGVKLRSGADNCRTMKDFKRTKTEESVRSSILQFADANCECIDKYLTKLKLIRKTLQSSHFFRTHEVIGSSLLFVHDDNRADIWLIDFAKTCPLPAGVRISHRDQWELHNHEDGYLLGLDNLIRLFSDLSCDKSQRGSTATACPLSSS